MCVCVCVCVCVCTRPYNTQCFGGKLSASVFPAAVLLLLVCSRQLSMACIKLIVCQLCNQWNKQRNQQQDINWTAFPVALSWFSGPDPRAYLISIRLWGLATITLATYRAR